jgi:hypothetical protein
LIDDELVLGHVDETRTESLMNGVRGERRKVKRWSRVNKYRPF